MTPLARYQQDLQQNTFVDDPIQASVIQRLQQLYDQIMRTDDASPQAMSSWFRVKKKPHVALQGLYLWGGVGRGKTYLMDVFYESLTMSKKSRLHFHRFMQQVHQQLTVASGKKNPLTSVAKHIANDTRVLCLDEFFVSDITDAMILARLFESLFAFGVILITTSNISPDRLYENGLQRSRFLPMIALLEKHCDIVHVGGDQDFRMRTLKQATLFVASRDDQADIQLMRHFKALTNGAMSENQSIVINGRALLARYLAGRAIWFDYKVLCASARSQHDYIELAKEFSTVVLSDVPQLTERINDQVRRFIYLVDEFYDRRVTLMVSAQAPIDTLYQGQSLAFEFERTESRLLEMQSVSYLKQPHRS